MDLTLTGRTSVVSTSGVAPTDATSFSEVILTDGVYCATRSDFNRIALTSGVAADDATFSGSVLTFGMAAMKAT